MKGRHTIVAMTMMGLLIWGGVGSVHGGAKDVLDVTVSIVPQQYFLQKIGGDLVKISVMVPPGANPAVFEPKPRQMVALTKSRFYFAIGVPFEQVWLRKFGEVNTSMKIVHTEEGIEKMPMKGTHQAGMQDRDHGIKDPHVWLSPPLVMIQARNILDALARADPDRRQEYERNYKSFILELVDLDLQIRSIFSGLGKDPKFMVYHPSWGYFARAYGLTQIPVEMEGKEPTPKEMERLIRYAEEVGLKAVLVQPQFSTKGARTLANALNGDVIVADPLERLWKENLLKVAETLKGIVE
ncbi:MAG: zinc ABC transporter substrate-binding protein [Deltaproteobacteria bacterium]